MTTPNLYKTKFEKVVLQAIKRLQAGEMVLLTDSKEREHEADFVCCASFITESQLNFMRQYGTGIICASLLREQAERLNLDLLVPTSKTHCPFQTPFTMSLDAHTPNNSGVSVKDRCKTLRTLADPNCESSSFHTPGHIFPLQAHPHGVLGRQGHTEGSIDLMQLAKLNPCAVICEAVAPDGNMLMGDALTAFALKHDILIISIEDILAYRRLLGHHLISESESNITTKYGGFEIKAFKDIFGYEHCVLYHEPPTDQCLLRIHSSCLTGDVFKSTMCDCGEQLETAQRMIATSSGAIIYLQQEGRSIGLVNKIKAYHLQHQGLDTLESNQKLDLPIDNRNYFTAAAICRKLRIHSVELLTNNPEKARQLEYYGISISRCIHMPATISNHNKKYLHTKVTKMNHHPDLISNIN